MVKEVGQKTREWGRRQHVISNNSRKTRRSSETIASCKEPEPRDRMRGTGSGRVGAREKKHKKTPQSYRRDVENGGDLGRRRKKRKQESIGSVDVDLQNLDNIKEAAREAQGAQGLVRTVERVCFLSRV